MLRKESMVLRADTGCDVSRTCLSCPLSECKLVDSGPYKRWLRSHRAERDGRVAQAVMEGWGMTALSNRWQIPLPVIQRIVEGRASAVAP